MIRLFTGQPGHGKTQFAIGEGLKLLAEGRTVYAGNIKGLDYDKTGFLPLEDFKTWQDLPDGSVVIWDECYDAIGVHGSRKPPPHVDALARHRHRGFDFILVAQQAKQLDGFVSGLIEQHWHFRRKFGSQLVRIKKWDQWQRDAQKAKPLVSETRKLDPKLWAMYKSATVHTVKRQVPWYFFALPIVIAVLAFALWGIPTSLLKRAGAFDEDASNHQDKGVIAQAVSGARGPNSTAKQLRVTDPLALLKPRVPGSPWTAPAYDELPLGRPPRLACIASEGSCFCLTADQGTRYDVPEGACFHIARYGRYDPTISGGQQQQPQRQLQRQPSTPQGPTGP